MTALLDKKTLLPFLDETHFEFRENVHRAMAKLATPEYLREIDEAKRFPREIVNMAAENGWFAVTLPEQYGGVGGYLEMVAILEVLGYHSVSFARFWNLNVNMVAGAIALLGTDEQKQEFLPAIAKGKHFFAFALSEDGSGSDAASLRTKATADGDGFIIDGTKMWITGAMQADHILVACRTNSDNSKHAGISLFLVPSGAPGLKVTPIDLLGGHIIRTCEVNLSSVRVAKSALLGGIDTGWTQLLKVLSKERIALSAICTGAAQAACDFAIAYANQREQFGQPINRFQAISHKLADMQTAIDAARLLVFRGAHLYANGLPCDVESAQAKVFGADTYLKVATEGIQIMGANGYSMEYPMQRHFRESKMFQIFGGTSEIMRTIIGRSLR